MFYCMNTQVADFSPLAARTGLQVLCCYDRRVPAVLTCLGFRALGCPPDLGWLAALCCPPDLCWRRAAPHSRPTYHSPG